MTTVTTAASGNGTHTYGREDAYERILDVLDGVQRMGDKAKARCPVQDNHRHGDRNPSLSITRAEDRVLIWCHVCQDNLKVLDALGWTMADLFHDRKGATYHYSDGAKVKRYYQDGKKQFNQQGHNPDGPTALWRLKKVLEAKGAGATICIVGGEDDVQALETLGVVATCNRMGEGNLDKANLSPLRGAKVVAVVDNDAAGERWAQTLWSLLAGEATSLKFVKAKVGKDSADHIAAGFSVRDFVPWQLPQKAPETDRSEPSGTPEQNGQQTGRFTVRRFADIQPRTSTWLLNDLLPDDDLTVFIGEEGIGKGLFAATVIARVTKAGHNVLIIATEDDFERVLRPRLDVAGADVSRCITMLADVDTLQGQPNLPHNRLEVEAVINEYKVRLVYIDPWVSSVSGGLRLQNTQDARSAIDPLLAMARATHCSVLAVAHPNRGEGDLRARVGLSAVLRQAARLLLFALEPPDDDTRLIVGIEKANDTGRSPAAVYRKVPRKHPELPRSVWAVEEVSDAPNMTIRQWHDRYRTDRDQRTSDRWPDVLSAAVDGLILRADIIAIYETSGSNEKAADKAIGRWLNTGRLEKKGGGVYELASS
jgi:hypothetical protein